ncbi:MAG: hypothetical protein ABIT38_19950 [Gemmatimonadaceae bacterium]
MQHTRKHSNHATHILPMGVQAMEAPSSGQVTRHARSSCAEGDALRRRLARARLYNAAAESGSTPEFSPTDTMPAPERPSIVGYRRLMTELFGHAGLVPPSRAGVRRETRDRPAAPSAALTSAQKLERRRALRLVIDGQQ